LSPRLKPTRRCNMFESLWNCGTVKSLQRHELVSAFIL
jgi:hypothetical protein